MKIVSVCVNNPIFIEMQYNSIKKFFKCENEYEIIIFNDAKTWPDITNFGNVTMKQQITNICKKLNIPCINIPNLHHIKQQSASVRHSDSMNFITKFMMRFPDKYLILDSDMFFINYFDISEFNNYYFCYVNQIRYIKQFAINYPWPNIFYIDIINIPYKHLINWSIMKNCDSGGRLFLWLSKLDKTKILQINWFSSGNWTENDIPVNINKNIKLFLNNDVRNKNGKYFSELYNNNILHYRGGSNWMKESSNTHKAMVYLLYKTLTII